MKKNPKYSIIIPAKNGGQYLQACIKSILCQRGDYELIVSDDHSLDGTPEFLASLRHPSVMVLSPPKSLSMAEHWEWALSHATGEWLIFVGQDDGLQSYFFEHAECLTKSAQKHNLRAIMSSRAYFFWPGYEFVYGDIAVSYRAFRHEKIYSTKWQTLRALLSFQHYFEMPQMYTSSLFHRTLLDDAKSKMGGKVFNAHPQDANLAAIACSLDSRYLKTFIPLGWVGSSPKSAGMAVSSTASIIEGADHQGLLALKREYQERITSSLIEYDYRAADFDFGDNAIYFWQALLRTSKLRGEAWNRFLESVFLQRLIFSSVLIRHFLFIGDLRGSKKYREILSRNHYKYTSSLLIALTLVPLHLGVFLIDILSKRIIPILFFPKRASFHITWKQDISITLAKASRICKNLVNGLL
jgi:glycosyltransferase involved in cell wall biosynthesis